MAGGAVRPGKPVDQDARTTCCVAKKRGIAIDVRA